MVCGKVSPFLPIISKNLYITPFHVRPYQSFALVLPGLLLLLPPLLAVSFFQLSTHFSFFSSCPAHLIGYLPRLPLLGPLIIILRTQLVPLEAPHLIHGLSHHRVSSWLARAAAYDATGRFSPLGPAAGFSSHSTHGDGSQVCGAAATADSLRAHNLDLVRLRDAGSVIK